MTFVQSQRRVGHARRTFFEGGSESAIQVPETILRSWRRCQRQGLQAQAKPQVEPVSGAQLREMRERHETLWRLARAELKLLSGDVGATGSVVILTDEKGWILDAEGSTAFLDKAGRVALMPGACWSEAHLGTNAIGTAIIEGAAVEVRGGEHYFAPHGILSCTSSPIFDPYGQLVGVLDISGNANVQHMHALGLVRLAVTQIEHRYFDTDIDGCELLRVHLDPALLGTPREGLLAFRSGKLAAANQVGLKLLGLDRGDIGRVTYDALFDEPLSHLRRDGVLLDRYGHPLHGRVDTREERPRAVVSRRLGTVSSHARHDRLGEAILFDSHLDGELERARRVLDASLPVLVQGETGCGKEVFARELHRRSTRAGGPFIAINCAALPEGLIEAELFGYEDGAFTGARRNGNAGLLRQADGGVLFLDEIGDMPLALQPRLLRVLQERELSPLGGGKPIKLDFALICATHQDLNDAIAERRFRADLYYRIAYHSVLIPSVRDHRDRSQLVRELWARLGQGCQLTAGALAALADYAWPGNLRQLCACLRTLAALHDVDAVIDVQALPAYVSSSPLARSLVSDSYGNAEDLHAMTDKAMRDALQACAGNVSQAARRLGISRSTLYRRLPWQGVEKKQDS